ncbi:hypothetical protein K505DRAFT_202926, partial [Melanomma pulvis-pyrius CBS 109.77]
AYQWDKWNHSLSLSHLYSSHLFSTLPSLQPASRLLSLPPELRLSIWTYVFTPPYPEHSSDMLALLATSRLIHDEAFALALQTATFHLRGHGARGLCIGPKLWNLGYKAEHLRHVSITMTFKMLDDLGSNNPFVLGKLPLDVLNIDFGHVKFPTVNEEIAFYYTFMSAFLYRTAPAILGEPTSFVNTSFTARNRRRIEVSMRQFEPTRVQLVDVMFRTRAEKVIVQHMRAVKDSLWCAFVYFGLLDHHYMVVTATRAAGDRTHYMLFGEEGE